MGLYARYVLPKVIHWTCSTRPIAKQRQKVVPSARGQVLEIGFGSGLNAPYYDAERVTRLWGLEPSLQMRELAAPFVLALPFEFEFLDLADGQIPLESNAVDTIVVTYTLCSIADPEPALREMARVLRPGGRLLFCEHGAAPDPAIRRWQDRVTPVWRRLGGGCRLNRDIPAIIEQGGFHIDRLDTMYIPGWRPACFNYWGAADVR